MSNSKYQEDSFQRREKIAHRLDIDKTELESLVQGLLGIGRLVISFSKVNRGTPVDRDETPESDTNHTLMLSLIACALSTKYKPNLDIGKVLQYALVHDLVEAYCGDTNTMNYRDLDSDAKHSREEEAFTKLKQEHQFFPWLAETIARYETLVDPESCFVKALDKAMPALLHNLNDGLIFEKGQKHFKDPAALQQGVRGRDTWLRDNSWAEDQDLALSRREVLMENVIFRQWQKYGTEE